MKKNYVIGIVGAAIIGATTLAGIHVYNESQREYERKFARAGEMQIDIAQDNYESADKTRRELELYINLARKHEDPISESKLKTLDNLAKDALLRIKNARLQASRKETSPVVHVSFSSSH
jgi:hypothetical protein